MNRVMYFDCFSGAAGDMMLASLLDAGLPAAALREALGSLGVDHELAITRVVRAGIAATHLTVHPGPAGDASHRHGAAHSHAPHDHGHSHGRSPGHDHAHGHGHHSVAEVEEAIRRSGLSASGRDRATAAYHRLAEAEAAIHNMPIEEVHLHEVGAVDSIIDVVGVVFAMEWFGIEDVIASPLNVGGGTVEIAHGTYPVPAPATLRLLAGVPIYSAGPPSELVTPTGALLMSTYARSFGSMPAMTVDRVGYGAGTRERKGVPNVLRVVVGDRIAEQARAGGSEQVLKIECEIDDMNPQLFGPVSDRLFAAGALDVFLAAVQMKKGRPGTLLTVLAPPEGRSALTELLFRETTTLGVRSAEMWRDTLARRWETVQVRGGQVRIKIASRHDETIGVMPEFDDCLRIADATDRPVREVQAEAMRAFHQSGSGTGRQTHPSPIE